MSKKTENNLDSEISIGSSEQITQDIVVEKKSKNPIRQIYDWVLHWADTRFGVLALILLAFTEPIFVPIPADILLVALCLGEPKRSIKYGLICSLFSIIGGTVAFSLGLAFGAHRLITIFDIVGFGSKAQLALDLYAKYDFWAIAISALTPVPYMLFSWLGGIAKISLTKFIAISIVFRTMRFGSEALIFYLFGERAKTFIDKYFNLATVVAVVLMIVIAYGVKLLQHLFTG